MTDDDIRRLAALLQKTKDSRAKVAAAEAEWREATRLVDAVTGKLARLKELVDALGGSGPAVQEWLKVQVADAGADLANQEKREADAWRAYFDAQTENVLIGTTLDGWRIIEPSPPPNEIDF